MQFRKSLIASLVSGGLALGATQGASADLAYAFSSLSVSNLKVFVVADPGTDTGATDLPNFFTGNNSFQSSTFANSIGTFNDTATGFAFGPDPNAGAACVTEGAFTCPAEDTFGPAKGFLAADATDGTYARADIDVSRSGLGGPGVAFTSTTETQATGNNFTRSNTTNSDLRWNFDFAVTSSETGTDGLASLRISYEALISVYRHAVGPNGTDRASTATTFDIAVTDITGGGSVNVFTWPVPNQNRGQGNADFEDDTTLFATTTNNVSLVPEAAVDQCSLTSGLVNPGGSCVQEADAFNFWTANILDPNRQYNIAFNVSTAASTTSVSTEPTTLGIVGLGLLGMGVAARRRKKVA